MGWGLRIAAGALAASALLASAVLWGTLRMVAPGPLAEPATVVIPRGSSLEAIATTLAEAGVVESPLLFLFDVKLSGAGRELKAGEYAFAPGISTDGVVTLMRQGKTVVRRLTVPEGLTAAQIVALVEKEPARAGEVHERPKDGTLCPRPITFPTATAARRCWSACARPWSRRWPRRGGTATPTCRCARRRRR